MNLYVLLCLFASTTVAVAQSDGDIRLRGSVENYKGRVEVFTNSDWGTVCNGNWNLNDAHVVCRQLGYTNAVAAHVRGVLIPDDSLVPIWRNNVQCTGRESKLTICSSHSSKSDLQDCTHNADASVVCSTDNSPEGTIRLVNGPSALEGRLEIIYKGAWGTVCDDSFSRTDAEVVCRQLKFSTVGATYFTDAHYGAGVGPILLDLVSCKGTESLLSLCGHAPWKMTTCGHEEDVGVRCQVQEPTTVPPPTVPPPPLPTTKSGGIRIGAESILQTAIIVIMGTIIRNAIFSIADI